MVKNLPCNVGDLGWTPGLGKSSGEGNSHPLQYSCLDIPWTEEPSGLQSIGSQRVRRNRAINTFTLHNCFYYIKYF